MKNNQKNGKNGKKGKKGLLLRLAQIERLLGVSRRTIYRWVESGEFPHPIKINRTKYWTKAQIEQYLITRLKLSPKETNKQLHTN